MHDMPHVSPIARYSAQPVLDGQDMCTVIGLRLLPASPDRRSSVHLLFPVQHAVISKTARTSLRCCGSRSDLIKVTGPPGYFDHKNIISESSTRILAARYPELQDLAEKGDSCDIHVGYSNKLKQTTTI